MDGLSILGLNLPLYIVTTLLFSYFIWSKFLKNKETIPKDINDLMDIFSIFVFLIVALFGLTSLGMIIAGLFSLNLNLPKVFDIAPNVVAIASLFGIWIITCRYRNDNPSKIDLKKIFVKFIKFFLFLFSIFIGLIILILFTALKYAFSNILFLLFLFLVLVCICYISVDNVLFKVNLTKDILNQKIFKIAPVLTLLFIVSGLFFIPIIKYNELIYEGYHIYDPDPEFGEAYLQIKVPIDIKTFGIFKSIIPLIPVNYGDYNLEISGKGGKNFGIWINSTNKEREQELIKSFEELTTFQEQAYKKFNFTGIILYENRDLLILKFDPKNIKKENINKIILKGYIKKNMSELDYSYYDNSRYSDSCNEKGCNFIFNITNNLNLPVFQDEDVIINFDNRNIKDKSKCKFVEVVSNFPTEGDVRMIDPFCDEKSCELEIRDNRLGKDIFDMQLYIDENVVRLHYIKIDRPISVNAQFKLEC